MGVETSVLGEIQPEQIPFPKKKSFQEFKMKTENSSQTKSQIICEWLACSKMIWPGVICYRDTATSHRRLAKTQKIIPAKLQECGIADRVDRLLSDRASETERRSAKWGSWASGLRIFHSNACARKHKCALTPSTYCLKHFQLSFQQQNLQTFFEK